MIGFLLGLLIAPLPDGWKRHPRLERFRRMDAQLLSAILEILLGGWIYYGNFMHAMETRSDAVVGGWVNSAEGTPFTGMLAMMPMAIAFMLTPMGFVPFVSGVEGLVRALETLHEVDQPGIWFFTLPWHLWRLLDRRLGAAQLLRELGPERPDEILMPDKAGGAVEVYAARKKEWSPVQTLEYGGNFFVLENETVIPWRGQKAYRYHFRPLRSGEMLRNAPIRYAKEPAHSPGDAPIS